MAELQRGQSTHISGQSSDAGRAQDKESSPTKDRRSTTVPRHHCIPKIEVASRKV